MQAGFEEAENISQTANLPTTVTEEKEAELQKNREVDDPCSPRPSPLGTPHPGTN